jgi:arginine deiminase
MQFGSIIKMERCGEDHQTLVKIMELVGNFIYYLGFMFV